ncbi:hypothetical protein TSUD_243200 [Trifolium subterraneum]|uniref:Reverse transcriptase zinc-binding domain-containing protein n=1 Tax=Trifolium subterraneum TaxID=3900 RepID=A0A2Z6PIY0_TRISU|nr:hypothetical protein TSUD_243200 [Trifolium subterraneum]
MACSIDRRLTNPPLHQSTATTASSSIDDHLFGHVTHLNLSSDSYPTLLTTRSPVESFAFKHIWKSGAPLRGVIGTVEASCPLCGGEVETSRHLFLHFRFAAGICHPSSTLLLRASALPSASLKIAPNPQLDNN